MSHNDYLHKFYPSFHIDIVCAKSSHEWKTVELVDCYISLHKAEYMKGPNLFQELNIKHKLENGIIDDWFETPIRSIKTEGNCCYHIK